MSCGCDSFRPAEVIRTKRLFYMIIPSAPAGTVASICVHSSLTLSPFRGWAQDGVSSATAVMFEDGVPPVMLTLTPIALRRPTHELASPREYSRPLRERFP